MDEKNGLFEVKSKTNVAHFGFGKFSGQQPGTDVTKHFMSVIYKFLY